MPAATTPEPSTPQPLADLRRASRRGAWAPATVLGLGVASIVMLLFISWIHERLIVRDVALARAIGEIQTRIATSHLWMEEHVSGDQVDLAALQGHLDRSLALARAMLEGSPATGGGAERIEPLNEPALVARATSLQSRIEEFAALAQRRREGYARGEDVGVGSAFDIVYDRIFMLVAEQSDALAATLNDRLDRNYRRSRLLVRASLGAWVAIVAIAVTGLARGERRRRQAEAALRRSEERLLQAQKLDAVGRLAGGLAHDINNYLAAIASQCELTKLKPEPPSRVVERMGTVLDTTMKAAGLIKRLLAFSRRQPAQPQVVDLNRVVGGLEPMARRLIGEDVELVTCLAGGLWSVRIDPGQLEQVIVNLLVNAREAMPTGGKVTLETANVMGAGAWSASTPAALGEHVLLAISDDGPGVPAAIRDRIFEPFFTTKGESGNSGLGLATVYGIVEQAGGHVWMYSEEGRGATFKIYLPRCREASEAAAVVVPRTAARGTERILLVEDEADLRRSLAGLLEALGYEVASASSADEAHRLVAAGGRPVDLVVTDVVMPGTSGRDLAEALRCERPELPVLFISGYTDNVVLRHGILAGEADFLPKPFSADQLAGKVRELIGRAPAAAGEHAAAGAASTS